MADYLLNLNQELLHLSIATMAGITLTADVLIKHYLKKRRKRASYNLLKRRFEYYRY